MRAFLLALALCLGQFAPAIAQVLPGSGITVTDGTNTIYGNGKIIFTSGAVASSGPTPGSVNVAIGGTNLCPTGCTFAGTVTFSDGGTWGSGGLNSSIIGGTTKAAGSFTTLTATTTFTGPDSGTWGSGGINGSVIGATTAENGTFTTDTATTFTLTNGGNLENDGSGNLELLGASGKNMLIGNTGGRVIVQQQTASTAETLELNATSTGQNVVLEYDDGSNGSKWQLEKNTNNGWLIADNANSATTMLISNGGNVTLGEGRSSGNQLTIPGSGNGIAITNLTTGTNSDTMCVGAGGTLLIQNSTCTISSVRFKNVLGDVAPSAALDEILHLQPKVFTMKPTDPPNPDPNATRPQVGLTAENVASVDPRLALYEDDMKTPKSYRQEAVIATLVGAMQEQQRQIDWMRRWLIALTIGLVATAGYARLLATAARNSL